MIPLPSARDWSGLVAPQAERKRERTHGERARRPDNENHHPRLRWTFGQRVEVLKTLVATKDTGADISFFLERNPSKFVISYFEMNSLSLPELKSAFPEEWILLGNPVMDESGLELLSGIPLFHSKDKKEVCYIGREKTAGFDKITLIFTGSFRPSRKITGIFNRVKG